MVWISIIGLASLVSAGNSILDKRLISTITVHPLACTISVSLVSLPISVIGILLLPPIPKLPAVEATCAGILYLAAVWLYYNLIAHEDISSVVPLLRITAVQTLIGSVMFLGDQLNVREYVAFAALLICSVLLSVRANRDGRLSIGKTLIKILPITSLLAGTNLLLAAAYQNTSVTLWHGQAWEAVGTASGLIFIWIIAFMRHISLSSAADRYGWGILLGEQVIRALTGLAPAWAVTQHVPIALVSAANGLNPMYVWMLARIFLHERTSGRELFLKVIGIAGVMAALFLLI